MKLSPRPFWVLIGGCLLAFLSTAMNTGIVLTLGTSVSQMSGEVSRIGRNLLDTSPEGFALGIDLTVAVSGFLGGAILAGFTIHHPTLDQSMPYGRCLMFIGGCLLLAHPALTSLPRNALGLCGFASGFQNAMATHYRGIILRTTHITGLVTDIGSHIGMVLRGHTIAPWKIVVPSLVVFFFFLGGIFGAWLVLFTQAPFLLWIGGMYILGGGVWYFFQRIVLKSKPIHSGSGA
jgi:uncharacterized membrane protein YoaK (UPF0700 family)